MTAVLAVSSLPSYTAVFLLSLCVLSDTQLVINVRNQGGDVVQETIAANVSFDTVSLEFQRSDGTLVTQLIDFRNTTGKKLDTTYNRSYLTFSVEDFYYIHEGGSLFCGYAINYQLYDVPYPEYDTILEAPFIKGAPTVFILHGYTKSKSETPNDWLRPPYLLKGYNIISVDYSRVVPAPCYAQAVVNSDTVAQCIAFFIARLLKKTEIKLEDIHVIGFSLGGHVAGRTGTYLRNYDFLLPRLTGLDVAGPLFHGPWTYITKESAAFVQVIHTNSLWYGKTKPVGHVDFFVNKGYVQKLPQCVNPKKNNIIAYMQCSHDLAPQYYAESILTVDRCFCGKAGGKEIIMGEYTPPNVRGKFYVETNQKPPYAKDVTCLNEVQILKALVLGEEERGQSQYQVMCFVFHTPRDAFIPSDAMSKLRQKNPGTIRVPEEDKGRTNYSMDYTVILKRSAVISPHIAEMCAEAADSSYTRYEDVKTWSSLQGLPESVYISALKRFPTTPLLTNSISDPDGQQSTQFQSCTDLKKVWSPCQCHLELCVGWYPCGLKYCKGKGENKGPMTYRCGIKTCRKCSLFSYYVPQKQLCLWDE